MQTRDKGQAVPLIRMMEPTAVRIGDREYRLMFDLRAAAMMEDVFGCCYTDVLFEAIQKPKEEGAPKPEPMTLTRQAQLVSLLLSSGGTPVPVVQLLQMHMQDFTLLSNAALCELLYKSPKAEPGAKKKAK